MSHTDEILEGYAVDIACLRKYPQNEIIERAKLHSCECLLMGHCLESGYALVNDEGKVFLLDPEASPHIYQICEQRSKDRGLKLRAKREFHDGSMHTSEIEGI